MDNSIQIQQLLLNQLQIPTKLLTHYKQMGLDETEVMVLLQIHRFIFDENEFPTPNELASVLTINDQQCSSLLRQLIQKGFLTIEQIKDDKGMWGEVYSLDPLWEKLFAPKVPDEKQEEGTLFVLFEQEFGRPLSPFEIETINVWIDEDNMQTSLIKTALREAVLMGKLNFKYIDRILREWKRKGVQTVEQAKNVAQTYHDHQVTKTNKSSNKKRDTSFYYNWLEGDD